METVEPLFENFLARQETAAKEIGSLVIPESARKKPNRATVIRLSSAFNKNTPWLKEGDVVFFVQGSAVELLINGEPMLLISTKSVLSYERLRD